MTIRTELHLGSPSLPLVSITKALGVAQISCVHALRPEPNRQLFVIEFPSSEALSEDALSNLDEVVDSTRFGEGSGRAVYMVTVELEESVTEAFEASPDAVLMDAITVTSDGWVEEKLFADFTALTEFKTACEDNGIGVEIGSITYDSSPSADAAPYGLTDRQFEALNLAFARGYYEQPKKTTAADLASEMNISQPSLSDLLSRAERQLLTVTLGPPNRLNVTEISGGKEHSNAN